MAIIIKTHMRRNAAVAPNHVCPGMRIHAVDMVQPPGMAISPIADMEMEHAIVAVALAAKSSDVTTRSALSDVRPQRKRATMAELPCGPTAPKPFIASARAVFVVAAPPDAALVAA